ncbi:MAG: twin transmembrane helix small protein [Nitrobacter sp.]|jgi:H+/Cl- antiporter ClcA
MIIFLSKVLIPIALASVAAVLLMGLFNMMRGGNPNRSQNLMRWRVFLQFIAIVLAMLTIWVMGQG